jgi:hypothetical protein
MTKLIRSIMTVALLLPVAVYAAGYHLSGQVSIIPDSTMQGNMSVRFNAAAAGSPYIYATGYAGSYVGFFGRDSDNEYFSCYVTTGNPIYAAAVDIKNSLQDGSRLYVTKTAASSECTNVFLGNYSYMQQ